MHLWQSQHWLNSYSSLRNNLKQLERLKLELFVLIGQRLQNHHWKHRHKELNRLQDLSKVDQSVPENAALSASEIGFELESASA